MTAETETTKDESPRLHLLRITLEAASPLSSGSSETATITDTEDGETKTRHVPALVRDANGLPTITGASLQGALAAQVDEATRKKYFGFAEGDEGSAGRLFVGFGAIHDSNDVAVTDLRFDADALGKDAILEPMLDGTNPGGPLRRDHVKLNERHVVDGRTKHERFAMPIGTRFSFEIALWGTASDTEADQKVLADMAAIVGRHDFRLGGATRRGYGRVVCRSASYRMFELMEKDDALRTVRSEQPSAKLKHDWTGKAASGGLPSGAARLIVDLAPINPWRVGGAKRRQPLTNGTLGAARITGKIPQYKDSDGRNYGANGETSDTSRAKVANEPKDVMVAYQDPVIDWSSKPARWCAVDAEQAVQHAGKASAEQDVFVVPASAIKGPLAHRTLFHWNRLKGNVIDWSKGREEAAKARDTFKDRSDSLQHLFGAAKESEDRGKTADAKVGRAGRILIEDARVSDVEVVQAVDHNSIDRFTGGVRAGALYVEEVLIGGTIRLDITILPQPTATIRTNRDNDGAPHETSDVQGDEEMVRRAFSSALRDLCEGRLAIGARSLGFLQLSKAETKPTWVGDAAKDWNEAWTATAAPAGNATGGQA